MKVFITRKLPDIAEQLLRNSGIAVKVFNKDRSILSKEIINQAKDCEALITLLSDKVDKNIIEKLPKLKIIANYAVGYNNIDTEFARNKKIIVTNTPDVLTDSTADLAITLALTCSRRILEAESYLRKGKFDGWKPKLLLGHDIKNSYFGIIGAGRIGQATAKRALAFGAKILYFSKSKKVEFEKSTGAKKVSLNLLLRQSDFISLHIPLTSETKNLIDKNKLKLLKKNSIIINTARGEVIDEKELISLLKKKQIFCAGFDVYQNEPNINSELLKLNNVVLLPHIGSATINTRNEMAELAAKNVINVLNGKRALTPIFK